LDDVSMADFILFPLAGRVRRWFLPLLFRLALRLTGIFARELSNWMFVLGHQATERPRYWRLGLNVAWYWNSFLHAGGTKGDGFA
jgi:hypothetical protein